MRLRALSVRDFRCIESAAITLHDGLNVLYGPNDLGKSTLVEAIRAALLLQHSSKQGSNYKPWGTDRVPEVELQLTDDSGRHWRVRKSFSTGRRGSATLEWSNDGAIWTMEDRNRGVDGRLRELLAWGVPDAGVRGSRGTPSSFLATILVGPQMQPGAVFNTSLANDGSESGRERLNEALQALAEDPLFKSVLEQAQTLVTRAFTKTGARSTAKTSPFRPLQDRINALSAKLRGLDEQVHSSEHVRDRLQGLQRGLDHAISDRDDAKQALTAAEAAWAALVARRAADEQLQHAVEARDAIQAQQRDLSELRDEQHACAEDIPAAEAALATADTNRATAQRAVDQARRRVEQIEQGGDAEGKLHKQSLQTRRLQLQAERDKVYERLLRAQKALAQQRAVEELRDEQQRLARDLEVAQQDAQAAERARRNAEGERTQLDGALALRRLAEAELRLAEAVDAAAQARELSALAQSRLEQAKGLRDALAAEALPSREEIEALRTLHQQLQVAEARLGGGLSLAVRRLDPGSPPVRSSADDDEPRPLGADETMHAQARINLMVGDGVVLEIVGGEATARAEAETLRGAWREQAEPVLSRLSLTTLEALVTRRSEGDAQLQRASTLSTEAQTLQQRADALGRTAADTDARAAVTEERRTALGDLPRDALEQFAGDRDEASLLAARTKADATMEEAGRTAGHRNKVVAELTADHDAKRRQIEQADAALTELVATLGGEAEAIATKTRDEHAALEGKLEAVTEELEAVDRKVADRIAQAQGHVEGTVRQLNDKTAVRTNAAERLDALKAKQATLAGKIQASQEQLSKADLASARDRVAERREALQALPQPQHEVDEEQLQRARAAARQTAARVQELDKELAGHRGELKQVGGNVVLQDRQETQQALDAARQDEDELQRDYDGYKLLVRVLRETERAEGRHLGQALSGPVRDRFSRLTAGRYGGLRLDGNLAAAGLEANGDVRNIEALSAGLQEQLATLLRLAVAEQLDSALVLDDHLTQTDPDRIEWFRTALLQTAAQTQVVVMTCRRGDYLDVGAESIHAVDLSKVIVRVPSTAESPAAESPTTV